MIEIVEKMPPLSNPNQSSTEALHASAYGDHPMFGVKDAGSQFINKNEEATKIMELAKTRLDTWDWVTGNATQEGIAAAKALADEVASLTPREAADVNTALIANYRNIYPTWNPVPTGMVNERDQSTGMEFRHSKFDFSYGPQSLQILDNGTTVTVRRELEPGRTEDNKYIPPVYIVDAQAARVRV